MKKRYLILSLSLVLLFSALSVSAAEFIFPEKGGSIIINEELENIYTGGNVVSINANVKKGLHASGNTINLNANVEGNFLVGGGTIIVKGNVGGTMYAGGGSIIIEGAIADDLFVAGGDIILTESSSVGGDLIVGAGTIVINGPIGGDIRLRGGEVIINSKVGGNVDIKIEKLELGDNAEIAGNFKYASKEEIEIDESKVLGEITFEQIKTVKAGLFGNLKMLIGLITIALLLKFLSAIAIGLIFVYLLKKFTKDIVKNSLQKFWPNLGLGLASLILIPIVAIILAISIIGLWLAGLIMVLYCLLLLLSSVFAGIILGTWLIKVLAKKKEYVIDWKAVLVGVIVIKIIILIPFIGWLAKLIFLLMSLGALMRWLYRKLV